jgi:hypothetical protein
MGGQMAWIAKDPQSYGGELVGTGQSVAFVEVAAGTPHSQQWRRGHLVKDHPVATGTAIATFDPDGRYGNHTDGRSHAAIFVAEEATGLRVWDQWANHPVSQRVIRFGGNEPVNDGNQFYVIELNDDQA